MYRSDLALAADLARLDCSTMYNLGVIPTLVAMTPLEYLESLANIPELSFLVGSYLGGFSTRKTSSLFSVAIFSATSTKVLV